MCAQDPSAFQMAFNEKACRKSMSSRAIPFQGGRARKKAGDFAVMQTLRPFRSGRNRTSLRKAV